MDVIEKAFRTLRPSDCSGRHLGNNFLTCYIIFFRILDIASVGRSCKEGANLYQDGRISQQMNAINIYFGMYCSHIYTINFEQGEIKMAKMVKDKKRNNWQCSDDFNNFRVVFSRAFCTITRRNNIYGRCRLENSRYYYAEFETLEDLLAVIREDQLSSSGKMDVSLKIREHSHRISSDINKRSLLRSNIFNEKFYVKCYEPETGTELNSYIGINHSGVWINCPELECEKDGDSDIINVSNCKSFYLQFAWFVRSVSNGNPDDVKLITIKKTDNGTTKLMTMLDWFNEFFRDEKTRFTSGLDRSKEFNIKEMVEYIENSLSVINY